MSDLTAAPSATRTFSLATASWYALLATVSLTTLAVAKVPFTGDPNPVVERFTGPQFLVMTTLLSVTLLLWVAGWIRGDVRPKPSRSFVGLAVFAAVATASALLADVVPLSVVGESGRYLGLVTWLCGAVALFLTAQLVDSRKRLTELSRVLIITGAIEALIAISQVLGSDILGFVFPQQWQWMLTQGIGTLGNPNHLAAILVIPLALASGQALKTSDAPWRWIGLGCAALMTVALVPAATRAAWIGAFVGIALLVALYLLKGRGQRNAALLLVVTLLISAGAGYVIADAGIMSTRIQPDAATPGSSELDKVSNGRLTLWRQSLTIAADRPLLGTGPDSLRNALYAKGLNSGKAGLFTDDPHSFPITALVSFGVMGLIPLAYGLFSAGWPAVKRVFAATDGAKSVEALIPWVAAICAWKLVGLISVLSVPFVLVMFVTVGAMLGPFLTRNESETALTTAIDGSLPLKVVDTVVCLALCAGAIYAAALPMHHNLRLTATPLVIPLTAQDIDALDQADEALPWRYEMINRRAARLLEQGSFELAQGATGEGVGEARIRALLVDVDERVETYPAEYYAWYARARAYVIASDEIADGGLARAAKVAISDALERFPGEPGLLELNTYLAQR